MNKLLIFAILLLSTQQMKNIFNFCGICLKTDDQVEEDLRPKKKDKKKNKNPEIYPEMQYMESANLKNQLLLQDQKRKQEQAERQKQILLEQQQKMQELELQRQEALRLQQLEQQRIEEEKRRQEMIRQQRLENDLKVKEQLQIPEICVFELYEPLDGEVIDETDTTVQKKIYQDQQYKLQTVIKLDVSQPQEYVNLFHAINTIQQAKEMGMDNVQRIEKCNFYSIYDEDQPTYYLSTVMPSTMGDLVFLTEENNSGLKFRTLIKKRKAQKYKAYKELFENLSKLHNNNLVMQSIEPKNLEYGFQPGQDEQDDQIKLYFLNIQNFEEETKDNVFNHKDNYFTHPAFLTYKKNEINRVQDIYALCLTALIVDSYNTQNEAEITTDFFFKTVNYFSDFEEQKKFPQRYTISQKVNHLKNYVKQQQNNLIQEISNFYKLQSNPLEAEVSSEEEYPKVQDDQKLQIPENDQNDKQMILDVSKITEREFESGSQEEDVKMIKKYKKICNNDFHCYMLFGLNSQIDQIPSANTLVKVMDILLENAVDSSQSSEGEIVMNVNQHNQSQIDDEQRNRSANNSSEEIPIVELKNQVKSDDNQIRNSLNRLILL